MEDDYEKLDLLELYKLSEDYKRKSYKINDYARKKEKEQISIEEESIIQGINAINLKRSLDILDELNDIRHEEHIIEANVLYICNFYPLMDGRYNTKFEIGEIKFKEAGIDIKIENNIVARGRLLLEELGEIAKKEKMSLEKFYSHISKYKDETGKIIKDIIEWEG